MSLSDRLKQYGANVLDAPRDIAEAGYRGVAGAVEAINPWDSESRGNDLINRTVKDYGVTPSFKKTLDQANPKVNSGSWQSQPGLVDNNLSNGIYKGRNRGTSAIQLANNAGTDTMMHEGLHSQWSDMPKEQRDTTAELLSRNLGSGQQKYLSEKLKKYTNYQPDRGLFEQDASIWNEIHSFAPESYGQFGPTQTMPQELRSYYDQYYTTPERTQLNNLADKNSLGQSLRRLLGEGQ